MVAKSVLLWPLMLVAAVVAQEPQRPGARPGTPVVSLFATVTDVEKRLVTNLVKEDFEVFDNDKPQPLVFFDAETPPVSVVVMLDTSGSMRELVPLVRRAAEQFLLRLLPSDKGRVGAFNDKIEFDAPVRARLQSDAARWARAQAGDSAETSRDDRPRPPELRGGFEPIQSRKVAALWRR